MSLILPNSWISIRGGDYTTNEKNDIVDGPFGSNLKSSEYVDSGIPIARIQNVKRFKFIDKNIRFVTEEKAALLARHSFRSGDIILTKLGEPLGLACIVPKVFSKGIIVADLVRFRPDNKITSAKFLIYLLNSEVVIKQIAKHVRGTTRARINLTVIRSLELPFPPLAEQKEIVAQLDKLLAQAESTKTRLDAVPAILKRFRQSVLTAAVSGKLTEEWRIKSGVLKASWTLDAAKDICDKVQSGSTPKNNPFDQGGTIPFLKVYNIVNQKINFDYKPQFITKEVHSKAVARSIAYPNDILMNIVGPPLGKIAILSDQFPEWNLNQAITLFRVNPERLDHKYLYYVLCEGELVRKVMPDTKGSVGQVNISLSQCRDSLIPAPTLLEQIEIVRRVDELFDYADKVEAQVYAAQERVNNLTQSILTKAFSGELTAKWRAQNPGLITGENSAAALLEKIKAERVALTAKKKPAKKTTARKAKA